MGTKCGPFTEKMRPTLNSELDHVVNGAKKRGTNYKKGTKCGPFTEKMRPTQEVQHLIRSF